MKRSNYKRTELDRYEMTEYMRERDRERGGGRERD